jgi:regulator of sirC expression with transglutaminase-like and TPR domain
MRSDSENQPRERFCHEVRQTDEQVNLARAALLIAAEEYPDLEAESYLRRLDTMALAVKSDVSIDDDPATIIAAINHRLFDLDGFRGNAEDYYDPRNSFLNEVLDRKVGIPITLSVVYLEVAWRLGIPLEGVNLPGHFILRWPMPGGHILIDPFTQGKLMSDEDCRRLVSDIQRDVFELAPEHLAAAGKKRILFRMLTNLKLIYIDRGDVRRALAATERMIAIHPTAVREYRDEGILHYRLKHYGQAIGSLRAYLDHLPQAEDADEIRRFIGQIRAELARLN